ncbi:hypothetical protein [Modicisalibacter xianhensis]|uniref:Uncharacterized protein n=1 Tax=Modicisalibacter xianhensis TaxID=442341 RepID=A0A1I3ERT1_9GAMM|nr:hypothetical protein [Halomonas xianhensis]SFI01676.1 hypothetical protein SAMN04487959_114139 [Halomonas xianhensis]
MKVKFQQWVAAVRRRMQDGQPLMGPDSLQALTDDVRKLGLGAMGAGVLGFFAPSEKISLGASVALFFLGAIIWVTGIALHARIERNSADEKD